MSGQGHLSFRIWASARQDGTLSSIEASAAVLTLEEAQRVAAMFPKSVKLVSSHLSGDPEGNRGCVTFIASLSANGTNGGVNETGLARYRTFRRVAATLGCDVVWETTFGNAVSEVEFECRAASRPEPPMLKQRQGWAHGGLHGPRR